MPIEVAPSLADILTLTGAAVAAVLVTTFVQLMKSVLPAIREMNLEQPLALITSLVLVILASVDRHMTTGSTTLNDVFVSFVAWLAIAKGATAIYDEVTAKPGSFRAPSE